MIGLDEGKRYENEQNKNMAEHNCPLATQALALLDAHAALDDSRLAHIVESIERIERSALDSHESIHRSIAELNSLVLKGLIYVATGLGACVISLLVYLWINRALIT